MWHLIRESEEISNMSSSNSVNQLHGEGQRSCFVQTLGLITKRNLHGITSCRTPRLEESWEDSQRDPSSGI